MNVMMSERRQGGSLKTHQIFIWSEKLRRELGGYRLGVVDGDRRRRRRWRRSGRWWRRRSGWRRRWLRDRRMKTVCLDWMFQSLVSWYH